MRGPWCCSSVLAFVSLAMASDESGDRLLNGTEHSTAVSESTGPGSVSYPETWVSDLFYRALANYTVRNVGSTACRTQSAMYEQNLRNYTRWAVESKYHTITYNNIMSLTYERLCIKVVCVHFEILRSTRLDHEN